MFGLKAWQRRRVLRKYPIPEALWRSEVLSLPVFDRLGPEQLVRLRQLAVLFMYEKSFEVASDFRLDDARCLRVAALAALPVLGLDIDWYDNFHSVVLYPGEFLAEREEHDEGGVVHTRRVALSGEAWDRGPVLLGWTEVADSGYCDGWNVVVHEMAHKLDMQRGGGADGMPPLHPDMHPGEWIRAFTDAYEDMDRRVAAGEHTPIDPYCLENPAECFAVFSEYFFELPALLRAEYPEVYRQLALFYRQQPLDDALRVAVPV